MTNLPVWIQVLQALLTPAIAVAVGAIAFLQWRTAHQKVILDLFDRRIKIYEVVADTVFKYVDGGMISSQARMRLRRAETEAKFLFGDEVAPQISRYSALILAHSRFVRQAESDKTSDDKRSELSDAAVEIDDELSSMLSAWTNMMLPYLKMSQKHVPSPVEWLGERNKIRLSYADDKQR
ncbi:hypothetical protein J3P71_17675 [Rhizobium leguminosarum]|uniref:hypothetical protein n=1 Tax=Rhizobium leguminosarum TaxID=384 RepID=UPI00144298A1|nr:hypothetical protein [Rhizobium leguminosarum]MBY5838062.1 hypothetical protein [Rhizobium leguminosarum]NKM82249.1 hypothetical protein [Rhizobium leguminosarum bv. viciae]QSZ06699.1 hypothetical protein J3P71_17675 [Rhizobium leguminosarum]